MVVQEKGWKIHGKACEDWNNVIVFVCDSNEKMVEKLDYFFVILPFYQKVWKV
jgi:hypothetical protein